MLSLSYNTSFLGRKALISLKKTSLFLFILGCQTSAMAATYYISPLGNDGNSGDLEALPWKTFAKAFSTMGGGNELIVLDGEYSEAAGTGYIDSAGTGSGQPPSGSDLNKLTYVHAKNPGKVKIIGRMRIGTSSIKKSYIKIQGLTFEGGGQLYNTNYVTVKDSGFHDSTQSSGQVFSVGTIDHNNGNTYNLIEDVWIWGNTRVIAINYRADNNVWRRVLVRGDGCSVSGCTGSGNPNVGLSVYNSSNVSVQNSIVIDRILGGGSPYSDFATAQHSPGATINQGADEYLGPNSWLGCISIKAPDGGFYFEGDSVNDNTVTIRNSVAWGSAASGFNMGPYLKNILLENLTAINTAVNGIRVAPGLTGTARNLVASNITGFGINSAIQPSYANVYSATTPYNQTTCSTGCKITNPFSDGNITSLKHVIRIENGSTLSKTGFNGQDYGANIIYKYGTDGTFYGQAGYDSLTTNSLWPWPNESQIKAELCADSSNNRGFCLAPSLSDYIWRILGNPPPPTNVTTN